VKTLYLRRSPGGRPLPKRKIKSQITEQRKKGADNGTKMAHGWLRYLNPRRKKKKKREFAAPHSEEKKRERGGTGNGLLPRPNRWAADGGGKRDRHVLGKKEKGGGQMALKDTANLVHGPPPRKKGGEREDPWPELWVQGGKGKGGGPPTGDRWGRTPIRSAGEGKRKKKRAAGACPLAARGGRGGREEKVPCIC